MKNVIKTGAPSMSGRDGGSFCRVEGKKCIMEDEGRLDAIKHACHSSYHIAMNGVES